MIIFPRGLPVSLAFGRCFYIEHSRIALDSMRAADRSPTPASKINDVPGVAISGGSGAARPGRFGGFRGPGRNYKYICQMSSESQPRIFCLAVLSALGILEIARSGFQVGFLPAIIPPFLIYVFLA